MPLIISPRHLTQRAEVFQQLASLNSAGVGLLPALEMVRNSPPSRGWRTVLNRLIQSLEQGATFSDSLAGVSKNWAPSFDKALIQAGESSGRLDTCFRFLSEYYSERARLGRQILGDIAYPALMVHLAVLIFPTSQLTRLILVGDVLGFILGKVAILAPLYGILLLLAYFAQSSRGEAWRSGMERVLRRVPVLGAARDNLALARLSMALESLLNAGVGMIEAWELAADASGSLGLRRAVRAWRADVSAGQTPGEAVRESRAFPELFSNLYNTGELSGQLDETLRRLHRHYQEEGIRKLHAVAQWAPRLVYFAVVLAVGYQIVSFWTGYYSQIGNMDF